MRRSFPSLFRHVALFLVITVLSAGMAMASYVCPEVTTKVMAMQMDDMPCAGTDIEKPVHCAELSSDTKVSLEHHNAPPALAPLSHAVLVRIVLSQPDALARTQFPVEVPTLGADPPYLRTLRIRI